MDFFDAQPMDQLFTFLPGDGSETLIINTTALMRHLSATKAKVLAEAPVTKEQADYVLQHHGVTVANLDKITDERLLDPILLIETSTTDENVEVVLVDGNHRYVRASDKGLTWLPACVVPQELWRPFVLENLPPEFVAGAEKDVATGGEGGTRLFHIMEVEAKQ